MFILAAIITALGLYELYKVVGIEKKHWEYADIF